MLVAIDIGNTTITVALLRKKKVMNIFAFETGEKVSVLKKQLARKFTVIHNRHKNIDGVIVCSVVPRVLKFVKPLIKTKFRLTPHVIGQNLIVPIRNKYRNPKQVGQDRLVCAYAAMKLFGSPAIIIDSGTAITFDVVSDRKEYLGGIIVPGLRLSAESLSKKTALLPKAPIKAPRELIGKDTQQSILSGLFFGYGEMVRGLVKMIRKRHKKRMKVIVTGGYTRLMKKFISKEIDHIQEDLVFQGMRLLFETQRSHH